MQSLKHEIALARFHKMVGHGAKGDQRHLIIYSDTLPWNKRICMNYLAHILLSDPGPEALVGNFMADAVKGTPEGRFTHGLVAGIRRHRSIDAFTDRHPLVLGAKVLVAKPRRRIAGIFLDLVFDHFLSRHWESFSNLPREAFIATSVQTLQRHSEWMPDATQGRLYRLDELLLSYHEIEGMTAVFDQIAFRRSFLQPMLGAEQDLEQNYAELEAAFLTFFPELMAHCSIPA